MENEVENEWLTAAGGLDLVNSGGISEWGQKMLEKYSEAGREAHNLTYLHKKLIEVQTVRNHLSNANAFVIALFFQYFNYDPKDVDLFEKNLEAFEEFATECGLAKSSDNHNVVRHLLEKASTSTEENKTDGEEDIHYFVDLDMVALGGNPEEYESYTKLIASEYSFVSSLTYKNLRKRVLQSLLLIPNIFATKIFRNKYEDQARRNIQNELAELT